MMLTIFRTLSKIDYRYLIIIILVIIILLQRACSPGCNTAVAQTTVTKTDTIYITNTKIVEKIVPSKPGKPKPAPKIPQYIPSEDIDTCKARFANLLKEHSKLTIYTDTIFLQDNIGTITVVDSVWLNKLLKRRIINDYKIPIITTTETITNKITEEARTQWYIGASLFGTAESLELATPGIIIKTKKDQIYQFNAGIDFNGNFSYGVGTYWKIKLKK
jgi:hypothetical protein